MCISQSKVRIEEVHKAGTTFSVYVKNNLKVLKLSNKKLQVSGSSLSKPIKNFSSNNNIQLSSHNEGPNKKIDLENLLTVAHQHYNASQVFLVMYFSLSMIRTLSQIVTLYSQVYLPFQCYLYFVLNVFPFKGSQKKCEEKSVAILDSQSDKLCLSEISLSVCCVTKEQLNLISKKILSTLDSFCDHENVLQIQIASSLLRYAKITYNVEFGSVKKNQKNSNRICLLLNHNAYPDERIKRTSAKCFELEMDMPEKNIQQSYSLILLNISERCEEFEFSCFKTTHVERIIFVLRQLLHEIEKPTGWLGDLNFPNKRTKTSHKSKIHFDPESNVRVTSGISRENNTLNKLLSPPNEDVRREIFRMSTFARLPQTIRINAQQYAKAGFHYLGVSDKVQCFACENIMENLTPQMDPFLLRMHRTTCKFTRKEDSCGNVPLHPEADSGFVRRQPSAGEILMNRNQASAPPTLLSNEILNRPVVAPPSSIQTATVVNTSNAPAPIPPPVHSVPLMRHMANIIDPDHERFLRQLDLCQEVERVRSFTAAWPRDTLPSPRRMASAGWFYLGNLDRTQCFSCGGVLRNWTLMDNPAVEHLSHFPSCAMAQGCEPRNVPEVSEPPLPPVSTRALTAEERIGLREMFPCEFPSTPHMAQIDNRLATFVNWLYTRATPRMIAEAGFFSLGVRDRVKCFYCNGGLQNWRRNDDAWEQHAKWYPTCEYVLQNKGVEYVHSVVARYPDIDRPVPRSQGLDVAPRSTVNPPVQTQEVRQPSRSVLEEAMDSEVASAIVGMGFDVDVVRQVMQIRIDQQGDPYTSAAELLDAVVSHEQTSQNEEERRPAESAPAPSTASRSTSLQFPTEDFQQQEEDIYQSSMEQIQEEGRDVPESMPSASSFHSVDIVSGSHENQENQNLDMEEDEHVDEATRLQQRLEELTSERLCKVCLDRRADMVFIPCNHICCCMECTRALRFCPVCRVRIEKGIRTFSRNY
uniref:ZF(RING)-14 zinc finger protein n=1 Tax=Phallusia mammillata TaxID=59560 RepID=A0A6F9D8D1_9ASCI|nr:ZF(RING)-14 zinc finger protein [Phallusia mammillata]